LGRFAKKVAAASSLLLWRLSKAHTWSASVLVDELDAGGSEFSFDDFECLWIAGVAPNLDVVDRVSVETGRFSEVSNGPI
jgi:hypothetical protein